MKKFFVFVMLLMAVCHLNAQQAKYVFYFIGDGMGLNQVNTTEMFLAEVEGRIGIKALLFPSFPVASHANSHSASSSVTDSAAAGTALASGEKTYNGAMGVDVDKNPIESFAEKAKKAGKRVGITTSVSIDHATPGTHYAHEINRNMYYEIALWLPKSNFDFFAGSGFQKPEKTFDGKDAPSIFPIFEQAGYTLARGVNEYKAKRNSAQKMILMEKADADQTSLRYAIDRQPGDLTLSEITESAIDFLMKENAKKGFFLMVEGGKIDYAGHANDAATMAYELEDMDNAVKVAYEFYKKHPKETLIVVTADHETGGLSMGRSSGGYALNLKALSYQKQSIDVLSRYITDLRKKDKVTWEDAKALLADKMGFWKELTITWDQEKQLRDCFEETFTRSRARFDENLYSRTEQLATIARNVMAEQAHLLWSSGSHTAAYVPVFAVGAGSQEFSGRMDNTEIIRKIAKVSGIKW
ncbi:MAG: alkaline phosphatase [Bacteroidaceae bacterium]|nr:alkaline phosphatase [Bacteroidaceae bacterium]